MNIFLEKAGVISPDPIWVCLCEGYMYTADTLEELVLILNQDWKTESNLIG